MTEQQHNTRRHKWEAVFITASGGKWACTQCGAYTNNAFLMDIYDPCPASLITASGALGQSSYAPAMNTGAPLDASLTVTIAFYRGKGGWYNRLIRWWTRSKYSHCEVVLATPEGNKYLTADAKNGVALRESTRGWPQDWDPVSLPVTEREYLAIREFIRSEVGSGYDWTGIFLSQIVGLRREHPTNWFCSELCAAVLKQSNCGLALLREPACAYSPRSLREAMITATRNP